MPDAGDHLITTVEAPKKRKRSDAGKPRQPKVRREVHEVFAEVLKSLETLYSPEERAKVLALVDTYYQNEGK